MQNSLSLIQAGILAQVGYRSWHRPVSISVFYLYDNSQMISVSSNEIIRMTFMQNSLNLFPIHDHKGFKQYTQAQKQHTEHKLPLDGPLFKYQCHNGNH